jgi:hypothetical protein
MKVFYCHKGCQRSHLKQHKVDTAMWKQHRQRTAEANYTGVYFDPFGFHGLSLHITN